MVGVVVVGHAQVLAVAAAGDDSYNDNNYYYNSNRSSGGGGGSSRPRPGSCRGCGGAPARFQVTFYKNSDSNSVMVVIGFVNSDRLGPW